TAGHVRINGMRIVAASRAVRLGDVVTIALDRRVRLVKVTGYAVRRGSADDAQGLFEDLTPAAARQPDSPEGERELGAGRPPKRERRELDRLLRSDGIDPE